MPVLGQPQRCTCCGETGHNRRKCTRSSHKEVPVVFADKELYVADDALPGRGAHRGATSSEYLGVTKVGDETWRANVRDGRKSETRGFSSETEAATWFAAHPFTADRDQRLEDEFAVPMTGEQVETVASLWGFTLPRQTATATRGNPHQYSHTRFRNQGAQESGRQWDAVVFDGGQHVAGLGRYASSAEACLHSMYFKRHKKSLKSVWSFRSVEELPHYDHARGVVPHGVWLCPRSPRAHASLPDHPARVSSQGPARVCLSPRTAHARRLTRCVCSRSPCSALVGWVDERSDSDERSGGSS